MLTQLLSFPCGKDIEGKAKSEIRKHYQKDHRSWDFKPLLEKAKPTLADSSLDKPKALIRNVASQLFPRKCWK